jgi:hypothetical protein
MQDNIDPTANIDKETPDLDPLDSNCQARGRHHRSDTPGPLPILEMPLRILMVLIIKCEEFATVELSNISSALKSPLVSRGGGYRHILDQSVWNEAKSTPHFVTSPHTVVFQV